MKYIEIKAPAKINFGLNIVCKRDDGFHNLETLFYPINDLFDILTFTLSDNFEFECNHGLLQIETDNLVVKAVKLLEDKFKRKLNVKITLDKRIPVGAGLGGGSSDAATVLVCLNEMFKLKLKYDELLKLALGLGSDVPFFIKPFPSVGKSRGEILKPIEFDIPLPILIVNPGIHISTKEAFQNIKPKDSVFDYTFLNSRKEFNWSNLTQVITNDFEEYIFSVYPEVGNIKKEMLNAGALFSLMSGTGSTVYGIFKDVESADKVKCKFPEHYFKFISHSI